MAPLTDRLASKPREDVYELRGVALSVQTDEQLAKLREKYPDIKASVSIAVTWGLKTKRKFIGDDEITEETDYFRLTNSNGVQDEQLNAMATAQPHARHWSA